MILQLFDFKNKSIDTYLQQTHLFRIKVISKNVTANPHILKKGQTICLETCHELFIVWKLHVMPWVCTIYVQCVCRITNHIHRHWLNSMTTIWVNLRTIFLLWSFNELDYHSMHFSHTFYWPRGYHMTCR